MMLKKPDVPPVDVVAGILEYEGRFLIARRSNHGRLPNLWEFPGGKVELGEEPTEALKREFLEELGVTIDVGKPVGTNIHQYPDGSVRLSGFKVYHQTGRFETRVHEELRWVRLSELRDFPLAPADIPLVRALVEE